MPGLDLFLYITSLSSKILALTIFTAQNLSVLANVVCIASALCGIYFSYQNYKRNKVLDDEKRKLEKEEKRFENKVKHNKSGGSK